MSHHAIPSFEDQAVFVHDVEACLKQLNEGDAQIVTMVGLHGLSKEEVGALLRCSRNWINVRYLESLDALTQIFLDAGVLSRRKPDRQTWQMSHRTLPNLADGSSPEKTLRVRQTVPILGGASAPDANSVCRATLRVVRKLRASRVRPSTYLGLISVITLL